MPSAVQSSPRYYAYSTIKAPDKGEVGGSSPPRPTINHQCLCDYPHFCPLVDCRSKSNLPTICQLSGRADKGAIGTFCVCRLPTPSSRGGRQSAGWESLNTTVGSLHRNKDEPDPSGLQERAPGRTEGPRRAIVQPELVGPKNDPVTCRSPMT